MKKIRVCFEVNQQDEHGERNVFGVEMSLGEMKGEIDYSKLTEHINLGAVLEMCGLNGVVSPEDVTVITPGEYDNKYDS